MEASKYDRLRGLADIAAALDLPHVRDDALSVADRIGDGQFYVACIGQFKRGKSTLLDALVDDDVLPSGIVPVTSVPTVVRYGERREARVRFRELTPSASVANAWQPIAPNELAQFVSEEHNPGNERGVVAVEVFVPSPLLADGMCLVDTPGLGSVFEANSAATRAFIPHIDAVIVVIGADPPLSGDELDLIADVGRQVEHVLVVLNKADRVTDEERRVASQFARTAIERRIRRQVGCIYQVSALERLSRSGPPRDWEAFVLALRTLTETSGRRLVAEAGRRAITRLAAQLLATIRNDRTNTLRPVEESDAHLRALNAVIRDGERALLDLGALFAVEQQRLSQQLTAERSQFLRECLPHASSILTNRIASITGSFGPSLRRAMMHAAQEVARETLAPWLAAQQARAQAAYEESMSRFVTLVQGFLDRLADSGIAELDSTRDAFEAGAILGGRSTFVFNDVIRVAEPASPLRFVVDVALGVVARGALERDAVAFLGWLMEMNSSRVQGDVDQRAAESRRQLETQIRRLLTDVGARAKRAFARAAEARAAGASAIERELARLQNLEDRLTRLADLNPSQ